jgi:uncharacterized protein YecT (DUF1311 family)
MLIVRQAQYLVAGALLSTAIICCPILARADETAQKDKIDVAMEKAMDADPSTGGSVQAIARAEKQWDARMNSVYDSLHHKMAPGEWRALVAAQKSWVAFRDAQKKSVEQIFNRMKGSMYVPVAASQSMKLTKERALYLQSLLATIEER